MTTPARRGHGDAKVWKSEADGRWYTFVELERGPDGKRRRKKIAASSRAQVIKKRDDVRTNGANDERLTVAQLLELWVNHRKGRVSKSTLSNYETIAKKHISDSLVGRRAVAKITTLDVERLLLEKEKTYSPRTVKLIRTVLRAAVEWGIQRNLAPAPNVVTWAEGPRLGQTKHRAMTEVQARAVLEAAKGIKFEAAIAIMLSLGLRPGECLALRWSDVDLKGHTLTVRHGLKRDGTLGDVKNDGSRRQLTLPEELVPILRKRRETQDLERQDAEEYWFADPVDPLVFTTEYGTPVSDRNLANRDFRAVCNAAGVGVWHLHECRHTCATLLLAAGQPIEVVSKVLGHSDIRVTANVYAHLLPRHLAPAAEKIGQVLWA